MRVLHRDDGEVVEDVIWWEDFGHLHLNRTSDWFLAIYHYISINWDN